REQQDQLARKLVATDKNGARNALRKRKQFEEEIAKLQKQTISIEQQLTALENANLNKETMKYMKQGADAMKKINKGMDVDKLDETMDDIRDQVALGEEISNAISQPLVETDEADLEADLEELEQSMLEDEITNVNQPSTELPSVPKQKVGLDTEVDEEEALRQLEAEMAV
ncbi:hypothetical protein FF38_06034, partial [Lucilia cuprina]